MGRDYDGKRRPNASLIIVIILIIIAVIIIIILWCCTKNRSNNLPAPTGLTATTTDNKVALNWNTVPGATRYRVYISQNANFDRNSASAKQDVNSPPATVSNLENATYYFAVASVKTCNGFETVGVLSAPVSATVPQCSGSPGAPSQLVVSPGHYCGAIDLQWSQVSGAAKYNLYRSEGMNVSPSNYQQQATVQGSNYRATFIDLQSGSTQSFVVTAVNACGTEGSPSPLESIIVPAPEEYGEDGQQRPQKRSAGKVGGSSRNSTDKKVSDNDNDNDNDNEYVTITDVVNGGSKLTVSWQPMEGATEYTAYVKEGHNLGTDEGDYDYKQVLTATITQYTFNNLVPGRTYSVGVTALKNGEETGIAFHPIELKPLTNADRWLEKEEE